MKRLGLIGGISPESTAIYYRLLNEAARARFGGVHTAPLLIWSVDFAEIDDAYRRSDWPTYEAIIVSAAKGLERAGAEALMICSNTTHLAAAAVRDAVSVPLVHLIDALANEIETAGSRRPLLLGTAFVMEGPFYRADLEERHGIATLTPEEADRRLTNQIIFEELVRGNVTAKARSAFASMIDSAVAAGADSVILGCTELSMILGPDEAPIPVFDTTRIHAAAGAAAAFGCEGAH